MQGGLVQEGVRANNRRLDPETYMHRFIVSAFAPAALIAAALVIPSAATAAVCKCPKNYSPSGVSDAGHTFWECVRKPGAVPHGQHPAPLPCNGQSKRGPA
jgi:hypothetical protein